MAHDDDPPDENKRWDNEDDCDESHRIKELLERLKMLLEIITMLVRLIDM